MILLNIEKISWQIAIKRLSDKKCFIHIQLKEDLFKLLKFSRNKIHHDSFKGTFKGSS